MKKYDGNLALNHELGGALLRIRINQPNNIFWTVPSDEERTNSRGEYRGRRKKLNLTAIEWVTTGEEKRSERESCAVDKKSSLSTNERLLTLQPFFLISF